MTTTPPTFTELAESTLDVWLKFEADDDEEAAYEANTFKSPDGTYRVEWSHTAVGQVSTRQFDTREAAAAWLQENDFQDFSS